MGVCYIKAEGPEQPTPITWSLMKKLHNKSYPRRIFDMTLEGLQAQQNRLPNLTSCCQEEKGKERHSDTTVQAWHCKLDSERHRSSPEKEQNTGPLPPSGIMSPE